MNAERCMFLLSSLAMGGSEKKTVSVANQLTMRGWDIHLGVLGGPQDLLPAVGVGVNVLQLGRRRRIDFSVVRQLHRYFMAQHITKIWNVNLFSLLYAHLAGRELSPRLRQIVSINTTDFYSSYDRMQMLLYAPLIRRAETVIFGSTAQQEIWVKRYRLDRRKTTVIYNGVDAEHFLALAPTRDLPESSRRLTLGMVGQFRPEKGHTILLDALAQLRRNDFAIRLLLVGDGPELTAVQQRVDRMGLSQVVEFVGRTADVRSYLASMDVFILPSLAVETFSNAALEAMATGLPVILSNIGGAAEMIVDGESGFLCPPGDSEALVSAVRRLMDPGLRKTLGAAARARVARRFSIDTMVTRYEEILRC